MEDVRSLDVLKSKLRERYKANTAIKRLFYPNHPLPLDECYIHLALIEQDQFKEVKIEPNNHTDKREYILRDYERIKKLSSTLKVKEILTQCASPQKRIFIEGPAGSGKTTFCRYIAYQWALGEESEEPWAQEYDWLFWIPLRQLTAKRYGDNKDDIIYMLSRECFGFNLLTDLNGDEKKILLGEIRNKPSKILWLLDGYDEFNKEQSPAIIELWETLQAGQNLLVTSRPGQQINLDPAINYQLAVLGLSDKQIKKYIKAFFRYTPAISSPAIDELIGYLENNANLWSVAHTPITLEMLCSLWALNFQLNHSRKFKLESDTTLTDLYQVIVNQLLLRYYSRLNPDKLGNTVLIKNGCQSYLNFMEHLAYLGMQSGKILLTQEHINSTLKIANIEEDSGTFFQNLQGLGLVNLYQEGQEIVQIEFAHLTFQEFFAARYIKKLLKLIVESEFKERENFLPLINYIQQQKHESFNEVMWWFVAGLLAKKQTIALSIDWNKKDNLDELTRTVPKHTRELQALQLFFDLLLSEPRPQVEYNEICLLARCLDEAKLPNIMQKEAIINHYNHWLKYYMNERILLGGSIYKIEQTYLLSSLLAADNRVIDVLIDIVYQTNESVFAVMTMLKQQHVNLQPDQSIKLETALLKLLNETDRIEVYLVLNKMVNCRPIYKTDHIDSKLLELLMHHDKDVREKAAFTISRIGINDTKLLEENVLTYKDDIDKFDSIVSNLGSYATDNLLDVLLTHIDKIKWIFAPQRILKSTHEVKLRCLLNENNIKSCCVAIRFIASLNKFAPDNLKKKLLTLANSPYDRIRYAVAQAIGQLANYNIHITNEFQDALFTLITLDKSLQVRIAAIRAIGDFHSILPKKLKDLLLNSYKEEDREILVSYVKTIEDLIGNTIKNSSDLRKIKEEDREILVSYVITIKDPISDMTKKPKAVRSIKKELINTLLLISSAKNINDEIFENVAVALASTSNISDPAIYENDKFDKLLKKAIDSSNRVTRRCAAAIIGHIDKGYIKYQSGLEKLLKDPETYVRQGAASAIGDIGCYITDDSLKNTLLSMCHEKVKATCVFAFLAIKKLGNYATPYLQEGIMKLLDNIPNKDKDYIECCLKAAYSLSIYSSGIKAKLETILQDDKHPLHIETLKLFGNSKSQNPYIIAKILANNPTLRIPPSSLTLASFDPSLPLSCGTVLPAIINDNKQPMLTEDYWTVALVRRGEEQHAFLVVEGIKSAVRFATKIHLVTPNTPADIDSSKAIAEIKIEELDDFKRLSELNNNAKCQVYSVTTDLVNRLLENVKADQNKDIAYSQPGDGRIYSLFFGNQEKHNCISWCLKQLQQVGIPIKRKWYDAIVVMPSEYLPIEPKTEPGRSCVLS